MPLRDDEGADLRFGLRPDALAIAKPLDQPAVLHGSEPKAELAHTAVGEKSVDFGEERRVHEGTLTRFSVHVNPHGTTCVPQTADLLVRGMGNADWELRLRKAIQVRWLDQGRSLAELSRQAGMAQNYVSQMLNDGKAPRAQAVISLAEALGVSLTWVYLGIEMTAEDEKLLQIAAKVDATQKRQLLDLLSSIASEKP